MQVSIPPDPDGFVARECLDKDCSPGYFKIKEGTGLTGEECTQAFCPYCRRSAAKNEFFTKTQLQYAEQIALREAEKSVQQSIAEALGFPPSGGKKKIGRNGLISMEMSFKPTSLTPVWKPIEEELRRDITCPKCGLAHAVFGLAIWCPDCGSDIFLSHAESELVVIERILADVDERRKRLGVRVAARDLENALEDVVTLFEAVLKIITRRGLKHRGVPDIEIEKRMRKIGNAFQSIERASEEIRNEFNLELFDGIDQLKVQRLRAAFEKRHPITHNLGVVDRKYLEKIRSGELEGREVRVQPAEILDTIGTTKVVIHLMYSRVFPSGFLDG